MHRLFVALRPSAPIRAILTATMGGVEQAKWQRDDQLHMTLRFIGSVDARVADDIAATLATLRHPRFDIALSGIGSFDRKGRIDTLWAGIAPHDHATALHAKIDRALVRIGLPPEGRAYVPHITLARFGRHGGLPFDFVARHSSLSSPPFTADWFGLYESHIGQSGAHYALIERYPLD